MVHSGDGCSRIGSTPTDLPDQPLLQYGLSSVGFSGVAFGGGAGFAAGGGMGFAAGAAGRATAEPPVSVGATPAELSPPAGAAGRVGAGLGIRGGAVAIIPAALAEALAIALPDGLAEALAALGKALAAPAVALAVGAAGAGLWDGADAAVSAGGMVTVVTLAMLVTEGIGGADAVGEDVGAATGSCAVPPPNS